MRWPLHITIGITCALLIGITHAAFARALDCLLGEDDLTADGYGNR